MTEKQILISGIVALAGTVATLGGYIAHSYSKKESEYKKLLISSIESANKMAAVVEKNTDVMDKLIDKL